MLVERWAGRAWQSMGSPKAAHGVHGLGQCLRFTAKRPVQGIDIMTNGIEGPKTKDKSGTSDKFNSGEGILPGSRPAVT